MLIWKTNDLNVNIASVRYRCLLPLQYLEMIGYQSCVYARNQPIKFHDKSDIIIFVKSFSNYDLELAQQAHKAGLAIILDICDNIFLDEYTSQDSENLPPSQIFRQMSQIASAIVTTGATLKEYIEAEVGTFIPIFVIPDGNETIEDVRKAFFFVKWQRWLKLFLYRPISIILIIQTILKNQLLTYRHKFYKWLRKDVINRCFQIKAKVAHQVKILLGIEQKATILTNDNLNILEGKQDKNESFSQPINPPIQELQTSQINISALPNLNFNTVTTGESKRVIWFGNHGASYGNFGMLNILDIAEHLIKLSQEVNFSLLVVSNNYEKYCQHILPLPFKTEYISWHPLDIYKYISESHVTIVPNSKSAFSICKSANRAVLSLSLGVPVVATKTPALEVFNDCIICDEWESGLRAYLSDRQLVNQHITKARAIIEDNYSGQAIANQWANALNQIVNNKV